MAKGAFEQEVERVLGPAIDSMIDNFKKTIEKMIECSDEERQILWDSLKGEREFFVSALESKEERETLDQPNSPKEPS